MNSSDLWKLIDRIRGDLGIYSTDVVESLAALLTISGIGPDGDLAGVVVYGDRPGPELAPIPEDLRWDAWKALRGQRLLDFLRQRLVPGLREIGEQQRGQDLPLILASAVERLTGPQWLTLADALVEWVSTFNLASR